MYWIIENTRNHQRARVYAFNFGDACKLKGWDYIFCKVIKVSYYPI